MKTTNLKKLLLTGSAIVAVGAFSVGDALADAETLGGNETWASSGVPADGTQDGTTAGAGDAIDIDGYILTITNDQTADDGSGLDTFNIGAITDGGVGAVDSDVIIVQDAAGGALTVTIASHVSVDASNDFSVDNADGADAAVTVTVTDVLTVEQNLDITNNDADADVDVTVAVGGDVTIAGLTTITAAAGATAANASLSAATDATFTGGVVLDDDTGLASVVFNGTAAQAVVGAIDGDVDGEGTVSVTNTGGTVAFAGAIGAGNDLLAFTLSAGATATTAGVLDANTVTIAAGSSLTTSGEVTGDVALSGAAGTLAIGDNVGVTGVVNNTSGTDGVGILTSASAVGNTSTISGNVGATNSLSAISLTDAGTFVFGGTVAATTITATTAAGALTFGGDVTGAVNLAADATVNLADDADITGTVDNTSGADGAGTLALASAGANTSTISGAVGATNTLKAITTSAVGTVAFGSTVATDDLDLGAATTVTFANDVTVTNSLDFNNNAGTMTFADNADVTGDIISTGGANGTVDFSGTSTVTGQMGLAAGTGIAAMTVSGADETVTITGDSFFGTVDTVADSTLVFSGDVTASGAFTNDGTTRVAQGKTLSALSFAAGAAEGTIELIIGTTAAGVDESATLASTAALDLDLLDGTTANSASLSLVKGTGVIASGDEFVIGAGGATVLNMVDDTGETVSDNFALFNFTLYTGDSAGVTLGGDNDIVAVIAAVDATSVTATANNAAAADAILAVTAAEYAADANLAAVYDNVASASLTAVDEIVEALQPAADGGGFVAATTLVSQTSSITNTRLASLRTGDVETGMAAGNVSQGVSIWGQFFGSAGDHSSRDGIDGYDVDTLGVAVGIDTETLAEDWVWGLAFSYGDTDVDSNNANTTQTDIDSYQITLYTDYEIDDRTYVTGQLGYVFADNDTTRYDVGGVIALNANGDFDSEQLIARAELGRSYAYGSATIVPKVSANYMHYSADSYTETGAGGANLNVNSDDMNLFELGLGVEASWLNKNSDGSYLKPELRAGVRHDLIGDEFESNSSFTGGGATFKTDGIDPAQTTFNLGAGVTYYSTTNWDLSADYDFEAKSDYDAHSGVLRAAYKF